MLLKLIKSFLLFFLSGCAFFSSPSSKVTGIKCEVPDLEVLKQKLTSAQKSVLTCFSKHGRTEDSEKYKELIRTKEITIKCEPGKNPKLALADGPPSKRFPEVAVYTYKLIEKNPREYENALFRESIYWLGYQQISDIDVPGIAQICCNDNVPAACDLFKYHKKDFATEAYLRDYAKFQTQNQVVFRTALNAAVFASRSGQSPEKVRKLIYAPLEEINAAVLKSKMSRSEIKNFQSKLPEISQGIVLASISDRTNDKKLKKQSGQYLEKLISRFYSNPIDKEKVLLFSNIGEAIEAVLFKKPVDLTRSWELVKNRAEYVCRDLKKSEITGMNELLNSVSYSVFEMKNEIAPGAMFDIATNWANPCRQ